MVSCTPAFLKPKQPHNHLSAAAIQLVIQLEVELATSRGLYREYMELALQFGYIMMFASVAPWLIVFAAIVNGIDMRADAYNMLYNTRRTNQDHATSIGIWYDLFELIVFASILTNSFLIVFISDIFDKEPVELSEYYKLMAAVRPASLF